MQRKRYDSNHTQKRNRNDYKSSWGKTLNCISHWQIFCRLKVLQLNHSWLFIKPTVMLKVARNLVTEDPRLMMKRAAVEFRQSLPKTVSWWLINFELFWKCLLHWFICATIKLWMDSIVRLLRPYYQHLVTRPKQSLQNSIKKCLLNPLNHKNTSINKQSFYTTNAVSSS